jgi:hypothetical protein
MGTWFTPTPQSILGLKYNDWDLSLRDVFSVHDILFMFKNVIVKSYMDCLYLKWKCFLNVEFSVISSLSLVLELRDYCS